MYYFQYTPLLNPNSDIRLLTIGPGDPDSPLYLTLQKYNTSDPTLEYRALSYTWGSPDQAKVPIVINDRILEVMPNLETALRRIRSARLYRPELEAEEEVRIGNEPIWIDAICINQSDPDERSRQVRRMQEDYRGALKVVVWLGDFEEYSDSDLSRPASFPDLPQTTHQTVREVFALCRILAIPFSEGFRAEKERSDEATFLAVFFAPKVTGSQI